MKKLFGYDYVDGKFVINEGESKIVKFIFEKQEEYTTHPPKELVDNVLVIAQEKGEMLTYEEAESRVSYSAILEYIGKEIYANPEFRETIDDISKYNKPNMIYGILKKDAHIDSTPIISKEVWEKAQEKN